MGLSNEAARLYRPEMQIPFPLEEYKSRMTNVKEEMARQIDLSAKAFPILLKAIKPGCPINDANKAMEDYYKKAGIWGDSWWVGGYDIGIAFPPDWVGVFSYAPGHDAGDRTFPPGTVVNYESDFYLPQGAGLSPIMDTIAVTEDSVEILSKISQDLIVVEA